MTPPTVGERHLTGTQAGGPAADERGRGRGVMRSAEGAPASEPVAGRVTGGRVDTRHLERLVGMERLAGVPIDSTVGVMFARSWQGPWDSEAIADAYGDVAAELTRATASDRETARHRDALGSAQATGDTGMQPKTGRRQIIREMQDRMADGETRQNVMGDGFAALAQHAVETGDGVISE